MSDRKYCVGLVLSGPAEGGAEASLAGIARSPSHPLPSIGLSRSQRVPPFDVLREHCAQKPIVVDGTRHRGEHPFWARNIASAASFRVGKRVGPGNEGLV